MSLFTITFTDDEEILSTYHQGEPNQVKQPIGTSMLTILNANLDRLENIAAWYQLPSIEPPDNYQIIYDELKKEFPLINIYSADDWRIIHREFDSTKSHRLRLAIERLLQVIESTIDHPEYLDYRFMSNYLINEVLGAAVIFTLQIYESKHQFLSNSFYELQKLHIDERIAKAYQYFLEDNNCGTSFYYEYSDIDPRLEGLLYTTFLELVRRNKVVRKCKNCGRYFIPENRSDTIYCDNPSPEAPEMTCKEYGTRRLWYERQKEDEIATLSRKIASAKGMLAKRNPDIPEYAASYNYFKAQRLAWMKGVKAGERTQEEYKEWLLLMQSQKVIKEVVSDPE